MLNSQITAFDSTNRQVSYNVRDYGALADGISDDTQAIQQAIDNCHGEGGGIVRVPAGHYPICPIFLRSHVRLHLEKGAVLEGTPRIEEYKDLESDLFHTSKAAYNAKFLIVAVGAENVSITGEGKIDGNAEVHYDLENTNGHWWKVKDKKTRPGRMVWFAMCRNVRLEGVYLNNAPAWSLWVMGCENVDIRNLTIRTPYQAINTDGIDIDCSRNVRVSHCDIRTGDDALVLRAVNRIYKDKNPPCEQVHVENCTLASNCQAVRLSYIRDGIIRNVTMNNLTIYDSRRGIICQIPSPEQTPEKNMTATHIANGPVVENVVFSNIRIEARQPIWFYISDTTPADRLRNIRFENIDMQGSTPSVIRGSPKVPVQNFVMKNIRCELIDGERVFAYPESLCESVLAFAFENVQRLVMENVLFCGDNTTYPSDLPLVTLNEVQSITKQEWVNDTGRTLGM